MKTSQLIVMVAVTASSSLVMGQVYDPISNVLWRPRGIVTYAMLDVVLSGEVTLDLSSEQIEAHRQMHELFLAKRAEMRSVVDEQLNGTLIISGRELHEAWEKAGGEALHARLNKLERALEKELTATLLPHQVELANEILAKQRFKRGGTIALLTPPGGMEVQFERSPQEMLEVIEGKEDEIKDELDPLKEEYEEAVKSFEKRRSDLRRQQIDSGFSATGDDGVNELDALKEEYEEAVKSFERRIRDLRRQQINSGLSAMGDDGVKLRRLLEIAGVNLGGEGS